MRRFFALAAVAILVGGCYHVAVVTGAPAGTQEVDKPWQNTFVYGIVPPAEMNVKDQCQRGVAKVSTERSFLNGLVGAITSSIYTPMHVNVVCASGPVAR